MATCLYFPTGNVPISFHSPQVPLLEQTWTTHRWPVRVFSFLLAVTEVNCYLAFRYFVWDEERKMDFMAFRSKLGWALINNEFKKNNESRETISHCFEIIPT